MLLGTARGLVGGGRLLRCAARRLASGGPSTGEPLYDYHVPVLRDECLEYLQVKPGGVYVDCTLGGGGHTRAILNSGGSVIGFDQDPDAVAKASLVCKEFIDAGKLEIFQCNFRSFADVVLTKSALASARGGGGGGGVDGILMDLGVSSHQINEPSRGFAFGADGPLDMRMSKGQAVGAGGITAATIVNEYSADALANVLYDFGEETRSRQIAREIVSARPLLTTGQLEQVISRITSWAQRPKVLARCFQALRIAVNDEMGALDDALQSAHRCLRPNGRLVVISYHSLEDRRVKRLMRPAEGGMGGVGDAAWNPLFKRAQAPTEEEVARNRRARSAKLRVAERVDDGPADEAAALERRGGARAKKSFLGKKQLRKLQEQEQEQA